MSCYKEIEGFIFEGEKKRITGNGDQSATAANPTCSIALSQKNRKFKKKSGKH